jgi:hypothetical protein
MAFFRDEPKILEAFKTGKGIAWGDRHKDLYEGTERFYRPAYIANLISSWIPALDNGKVEQRLKQEGSPGNPVGRLFYAGSTMICVPTSLSQNGPALGAQAGEARISHVVKAGGFKHFRRATQTPFNIVYEAKP